MSPSATQPELGNCGKNSSKSIRLRSRRSRNNRLNEKRSAQSKFTQVELRPATDILPACELLPPRPLRKLFRFSRLVVPACKKLSEFTHFVVTPPLLAAFIRVAPT